jgi:hypothetical protein
MPRDIHSRAHLMPDYGGHFTGRYTPLSLISACNCKRQSSNAAPEDAGTPGACQGGSPLSLYSAGSLIVRGFAPETVVSLKPFSAAFRWFSSTASGTPARRNGLRMGIAIKVRARCQAGAVDMACLSGLVQGGSRGREKPSIWCRVRSLT